MPGTLKKLMLLFAGLFAVLSVHAQEIRPTVTEAPGEESIYKVECNAVSNRDPQGTNLDELCYRINFNEDKAYILNLFSVMQPLEEYVVADFVDNEISIPTNWIYSTSGKYAYYKVKRFVRNDSGEWEKDNTDTPVVLTRDENGVIRSKDTNVGIGLVEYMADEDENEGYLICCFSKMQFQPTEITGISIPDGAVRYTYRRFVNYSLEESYINSIIEVAEDGNDFYFKGLFNNPNLVMNTECWVKGTLEGNTITIPSSQLVGIDNRGYFCYNNKTHLDMDAGVFVIENSPVTFTYDKETFGMTTTDWLCCTQGREYPYFYFPEVELSKFERVAATPAQPTFVMYYDDNFFDYFGHTRLVFLINYFDQDGNFIDPNNITYSVFVDNDKPYVFTPDLYPELKEPTSEFGFFHSSQHHINTPSEGYQRHIVDFMTNEISKLGVQAYYTIDGVRNASPIMWYEHTGIEDVTTNSDGPVEYYNLQGVRITEPAAGEFVIRRQGNKVSKIIVR